MLKYDEELKQSDIGKYSHFHTKYLRCRKIEEILKQKHMRRVDIARMFDIDRATAGRYVDDLSMIILIQENDGYLYVDSN